MLKTYIHKFFNFFSIIHYFYYFINIDSTSEPLEVECFDWFNNHYNFQNVDK